MPLTPQFSIEQNDEFVFVSIHVPYIRVTNAELITDGCDFSFYCQPYLLKLSFPGEFHEDDERCKAVFDPTRENGTLTAHLPKRTIGEHFPGLDLATNLLQRRKRRDNAVPGGIEVLASADACGIDDVDEDEPVRSTLPALLQSAPRYGFNQSYSNVLGNLRDEMVDMIELRDPDRTPSTARRAARLRSETARFDIERYLGDFFDAAAQDDVYGAAMSYVPHWVQQWDAYKAMDAYDRKTAKEKQQQQQLQLEQQQQQCESTTETTAHSELPAATTGDGAHANEQTPAVSNQTILSDSGGDSNKDRAFQLLGGFTAAEQETMRNSLKHREYLITSEQENAILLSLADILFAHCYDVRLTQGEESNVESAANIARLSATLSWLDAFDRPSDDVAAVIKYNLRRSVILPYLRVWKLSRKVLTDVTKVLFLGRRTILKCLLHVRRVFEHTDTHYLLNKLYLDDYCVWLQCADNISDAALQRFASEYNAAKTAVETAPAQGKEYMGLHLPELEAWALHRQQEQQQGEEEDEEGDEEEDVESSDETESSSDEDEDSDEEDSDDSTQEDDVEQQAKGNDEDEGGAARGMMSAFLRSVPRRLRTYDNIDTSAPGLAYLDIASFTTTEPAVASLLDEQRVTSSQQVVSNMLSSGGGGGGSKGGGTTQPTPPADSNDHTTAPFDSYTRWSDFLVANQCGDRRSNNNSSAGAPKRLLIEELPDISSGGEGGGCAAVEASTTGGLPEKIPRLAAAEEEEEPGMGQVSKQFKGLSV